jgi:hypothetical protein
VRRLAVNLCRAQLSSLRLWRVCRQRRLLLPDIPGTGTRASHLSAQFNAIEVSNASSPKMGLSANATQSVRPKDSSPQRSTHPAQTSLGKMSCRASGRAVTFPVRIRRAARRFCYSTLAKIHGTSILISTLEGSSCWVERRQGVLRLIS